ncbi:hypothetical protein IWX87_003025 [Polaromonas sp. CG_9.7]|uniref:hypothetical protein n=1 Tax=unclassified Polaromonas TaxID=2638319 RepID=UPI0018C8E6CE|nr:MULTISPECIES: hypothetical protein [unclassified Polaromonas]MBG6073252.1 hypothetical protein [Polaromonas sp. CG_9.7]MDH6183464.1 hypothetical protein [Polaromonas sp. CG_23.6]
MALTAVVLTAIYSIALLFEFLCGYIPPKTVAPQLPDCAVAIALQVQGVHIEKPPH